jgi:hypothetical protein
MSYAQNPYNYIANIYEIQFSPEIFYAILSSDMLRIPLSLCIRPLKDAEELVNKVYVGVAEGNLIVIGDDEDNVKSAINILFEAEAIRTHKEIYINTFSASDTKSKLLAARVLARCVIDLILLQAYREGKWTILSSVGKYAIFSESSLVKDIEEPLKSVMNIYKGLTLSGIYFCESDVFGESEVKVGVSADYSLVIIPAISVGELIKSGIQYRFNEFLELKEGERKLWRSVGYKVRKYYTWNFIEEYCGKFFGCRYEKDSRREEWNLIEREFNPSEVYPVRKPEVIDQMLSEVSSEKLTKIAKRLSFQITDEGKRDYFAPFKRFEMTKKLLRNLYSSIQDKINLGSTNMIISEEPCIIRIWRHANEN